MFSCCETFLLGVDRVPITEKNILKIKCIDYSIAAVGIFT